MSSDLKDLLKSFCARRKKITPKRMNLEAGIKTHTLFIHFTWDLEENPS